MMKENGLLSTYRKMVDERLRALTFPTCNYYPHLYAAAHYALHSGGKRIRPILTLAATEMLKKEALTKAIDPACALELIHTYSLIHDDLPCMDDDDFRRGKPTVHKVYNEGHAVLVGDYLLTFAFEVLSNAPSLKSKQKITLIQTLARGAGGAGLIGGQVMDLSKSPDVDETSRRKTAALFSVALQFASIVCDAEDAIAKKLKEFGFLFGELFQILDDIEDKDHPNGNDYALAIKESLKHKTLASLDLFTGDTTILRELIDELVK